MSNAQSDLRHLRSLTRPVGEGGVMLSAHVGVPKLVRAVTNDNS